MKKVSGKQKWRNSKEYREWRKEVIERDGCCVVCDSKESLHAHHLNCAVYHPLLKFDVNNGVTLCYACHTLLHCHFKKNYRVKCTEDDFIDFKLLAKHFINKGGL